jgi:hypothetical protein
MVEFAIGRWRLAFGRQLSAVSKISWQFLRWRLLAVAKC